ncbi:unnamed protein product [Brachionus calyciflorus]|uniref:SWIM-type domain-containing protein n=1 Tax=Brachionus calyciflorus TaxID=104777 RepID=A0A813YVK5_9BILA|nr:unnamed protein product [Brachionus calyciflorus]
MLLRKCESEKCVNNFFEYFIKEYVDSKHRFWYEGAAISYPISAELWKNVDKYISLEPKIKYLKDVNLYLVATNDITEEKFGLVFDTIECEMNNCVYYYENFEFKEFVEFKNNVLRVKLNMSQWEMSSYTCRDYLKDYICVHTIVISVKKKLVKMNFASIQSVIK